MLKHLLSKVIHISFTTTRRPDYVTSRPVIITVHREYISRRRFLDQINIVNPSHTLFIILRSNIYTLNSVLELFTKWISVYVSTKSVWDVNQTKNGRVRTEEELGRWVTYLWWWKNTENLFKEVQKRILFYSVSSLFETKTYTVVFVCQIIRVN